MFDNSLENQSSTRTTDRSNKKLFFRKRKGCPLSGPDAPEVDYKNPELLKRFISEGGRILPSRVTNVCAKKQREIRKAIKIARVLGLLPYTFTSKH